MKVECDLIVSEVRLRYIGGYGAQAVVEDYLRPLKLAGHEPQSRMMVTVPLPAALAKALLDHFADAGMREIASQAEEKAPPVDRTL